MNQLTVRQVMTRLRVLMVSFLIGMYSIPAADHLNRWYVVTFIDVPEIASPTPLLVFPESERNPIVLGGGSSCGRILLLTNGV